MKSYLKTTMVLVAGIFAVAVARAEIKTTSLENVDLNTKVEGQIIKDGICYLKLEGESKLLKVGAVDYDACLAIRSLWQLNHIEDTENDTTPEDRVYGYNAYNSLNSIVYQWKNGQCVDVRTNTIVSGDSCLSNTGYGGYSFNPYYNMNDACQIYGPGWISSWNEQLGRHCVYAIPSYR